MAPPWTPPGRKWQKSLGPSRVKRKSDVVRQREGGEVSDAP